MKKVVLYAISIVTMMSFVSCGSKPAPEKSNNATAPVADESLEIEETTEETTEETEKPIDITSLFASVDSARKQAIEAGAEKFTPELLNKIDAQYSEVVNKSAEGLDITENCAKLEKDYLILTDAIKAIALKQKIEEEELMKYDQKDYNEGTAYLNELNDLLSQDTEFNDTVATLARNAYVSFNKVYLNAYRIIAKNERDLAFQAKQKADTVKAGISKKEPYKTAVDEFKAGDSSYAMQNPERAFEHYFTAKVSFLELFEEVSELRAEAERIMEEAKKRVAESEQFAAEADKKAPIKEEIEGIESEDAVLLEQDEYTDETIEVSESIENVEEIDKAALESLEDSFEETEEPTEEFEEESTETEETDSMEDSMEDSMDEVIDFEEDESDITDEIINNEISNFDINDVTYDGEYIEYNGYKIKKSDLEELSEKYNITEEDIENNNIDDEIIDDIIFDFINNETLEAE